jgi:6-phosphogluconolactonase
MLKTYPLLLSAVLAMSVVLPARSESQTSKSDAGAVFAMTNDADNNEIVTYKRNTDGSLAEGRKFSTGGRGSGGVTDPLGSQGSLVLNSDGTILMAVNSGSGEVSVFRVSGSSLLLVGKTPSLGSEPVAVAARGNLVYVLNAGGTADVVGFRLGGNGTLHPISGATFYLSSGSPGAASLAFSPDGQFLLVTEKINNVIDTFHVQIGGTLGPIVVTPSAGPGAFSVAFAPNGAALVSETGATGATNASAISSYAVAANGTLSSISASVPTLGAATCWQAVTPDGKFAYTSNSGTGTISGFAIGATGSLTPVAETIVGTNPTGSINLDVAISSDGKYLYTLNSGTGTVSVFGINADGTLNNLGDAGGLSENAGLNGIAAI